ncbi:LOW QUALITY PROTEIN: uncharacterized protein LOC103699650 [Phoenix dactylifera]|uniref:LOW QUALITY PROTEIN: uncharacterized protein LOC103699650 n=1 Tax=Phoenix dactylifera TaxID=42345 RepID=A0A8B8ZV98_PHODC|nr:LOW QUALITY PROTEIN: uncharacterized protein LOC103699650 [Phoenix dactylifera]
MNWGKNLSPTTLLFPFSPSMAMINPGGYAWAVAAGLNAALAAVSAKLFTFPLFKHMALVLFFNITMWGCYVNSLKASHLCKLRHKLRNNFLSSGLAGYFIFEEPLPSRVTNMVAGAILIILGVFILSQSSIERKSSSD